MKRQRLKLGLYNSDLVLLDSNGEMLPFQIDITVENEMLCTPTATVTLEIDLSEIKEIK